MVIFGLVWVKNGHYFGVKWPWITCWFCGLMWRYGHFGHFIISYLKNIYVCIQVYIAPNRASEGWKKMTKMTKARKTLSFQHVIMVMCMTQKWPSDDHSLHSICQRECNPATHDQNDQGLNVYLVYVNMLTLVYIWLSWQSGGGLGLAWSGNIYAGITQTFFYFKNVLQKILCLKACHTNLVK